jgi:hypothetical protein
MTEQERQDATVQALREAVHPHWRDAIEREVAERLAHIAVTPMPQRKPHRGPMQRGSDGRFVG